jgi:hypothetical protein
MTTNGHVSSRKMKLLGIACLGAALFLAVPSVSAHNIDIATFDMCSLHLPVCIEFYCHDHDPGFKATVEPQGNGYWVWIPTVVDGSYAEGWC